jgi:hypothetical protein
MELMVNRIQLQTQAIEAEVGGLRKSISKSIKSSFSLNQEG